MRAELNFSKRLRDESCLSDLVLDRLVAGESPARPDPAAVEQHLGSCAVCSARLDELRRDRSLAAPMLAAGRRRHTVLRRRRFLLAAAPALLAAAATLLLLLMPRLREHLPERIKGGGNGAALLLDVAVRHADGKVEALQPGGRVRPGDMVRFIVSTARPGHLVIMGLDTAGKVTVYVADGEAPRAIDRGARQVMPGSIVLDATLGAERLVALECDLRFNLADAVDAGRRQLDRASRDPRRTGPLGLPGCFEAAMVMDKRE
ncbi:MAG: hypothetical protein JWN44_6348 [Myxococcales bacterium]|nr:hypothetical protein [Myxococcales bacterium]